MGLEMKLLCRLCATADPERQLFDIFGFVENEFNLFANITKHLGIWVTQDQTLPTVACAFCVEKLQSFINFHNDCQKAQIFLEKMCCDPDNQDDIPLASLFENLNNEEVSENINIKREALDNENVKEEVSMDAVQNIEEYMYDDADGMLSNCELSPESSVERKPKRKKTLTKKYKIKRKRKPRSSVGESSDEGSRKSAQCLEKYFSFVCQLCNIDYENWHRLKMHSLDKHQQVPKVRCFVCGFYLKSRSTIYRHVSNHNDPSIFSCDQCSRVTKSQDALDRHKMKHNSKDGAVWQCEKCPKVFSARENLKSHERVHIPKDQRYIYPCDICGTKFTTKSAVAGHKRSVHDKLKRFMCDLCGYSCSTSGELAQHRAIHFEDKSFICSVCSKAFKTSSNLKAHQDTHDSTSYQCPHCDKVLNSRRTLKKHLLVHDDVCRHVCSFCNKAFKRRQTLKVHLTSHTGDTPIQCPWCTQKFAYSSAFRSHKQKCHPQEYALQQKLYQESLPKNATKTENVLIQKQEPSLNSYDEELSMGQKLFAEDLQPKSENIILIQKTENLEQKHFENGLAPLRKRLELTLLPKLFDK